MEQAGVGDRTSIVVDDYGDNLHSDSDNDEVASNPDQFEAFTRHGCVKIGEGSPEHEMIKRTFFLGMITLSREVEIVAVHKNMGNGFMGRARLQSFLIFEQAVGRKNDGYANVKRAWYGASREEICRILAHGFSLCSESAASDVSYGVGIHLRRFPIHSMESSVADENGLRHMLRCRVILGKTEAIPAHSKQFHPSSAKFDSGVDNLLVPIRYIVWSAFMNSHIFPGYIISFKQPSSQGLRLCSIPPSLTLVVSAIASFLDPPGLELFFKCWDDFRTKRITPHQLPQRLRQIAGDRVFFSIISTVEFQFLLKTSVMEGSSRNRGSNRN